MATKLPKHLSAGILLALDDLISIERSKKYRIAMDETYHDAADLDEPDAQCVVCFAGSVMARTLETPQHFTADPDNFDYATAQKLYALDNVRSGEIGEALDKWYDGDTPQLDSDLVYMKDNVIVTSYATDKAQFKRDMRRIAEQLAELGM